LDVLNAGDTNFKTDNTVPALTEEYYSHEGLEQLIDYYQAAYDAITPSWRALGIYETQFLNNLITPQRQNEIYEEYEDNRE
jgi:hypothetical protein